MPATQYLGETVQAIGSRAKILYAVESTWGTAAATASRAIRTLPGETLDQNIALYRSKQIRGDRMHNPNVRGSQDPKGSLPFELSPDGWNMMLWQLLGGSVTVTGPAGGLANPPTAPTGVPSASGGTLANGTYYYVNTGINATGETLPTPASTGQAVTGPTGSVALTATTITSATGYNFYRATAATGPFLFVGTSATTSFTDIGATGGAAAPYANTTGSIYTHVFKGATTTAMPLGFSLEKQFLDLTTSGGSANPQYLLFTGGRCDKMRLNFKIDAIPEGTFDCIFQQMAISGTSAFSNTPAQPTETPFTSSQVQIYEAATGTLLGLCTDMQLDIDNAYYAKSGYILGSTLRQNLKPGTRLTTFQGKFMFQDMNLYNKAINGTNTLIRIFCTAGSYSTEFLMNTAQFMPNQSAPKMTTDGPLEITLHGEALPDQSTGTDIQCTIKTGEATITN